MFLRNSLINTDFCDFRHDIIAVRSPSEPEKTLCKRVVGLPGDRILNTTSGQAINVGLSYCLDLNILC